MERLCKSNIYDYQVIYGEFAYKASSWDKERRVVVKVEKPEGQMCFNYTFVVSTMKSPPKKMIMFYCNRGTMENFIKESKNGFNFDSMSSSEFIANVNKFKLKQKNNHQIHLKYHNFEDRYSKINLVNSSGLFIQSKFIYG